MPAPDPRAAKPGLSSEDATVQTADSTAAKLSQLLTELFEVNAGAQERFIDFTDSLSALEYVNRVKDVFNVQVPFTALFDETPNVATLAALVDRLRTPSDQAPTASEARAPAVGTAVSPTRRAAANDEALDLPGGQWRVWKTVVLRGAGFAASLATELAAQRTAEAADRYLEARSEVVRHRVEAVRAIGPLIRSSTGDARRSLRRVRRQLQRSVARADGPTGAEADLAAAVERQQAAIAGLSAAYEADAQATAVTLLDIAARPRFREAALWQNRHALSLASRRLRGELDPSGAKRNAAAFVAMLVQRYATKNDSVGFFGPIGWARLGDDTLVVDARPGKALLARREVYFEGWAMDAVARRLDRDPALKPWSVPRLRAGVWLAPEHVYAPLHGQVAVSREQRILLELCNGYRTAHDIAEQVIADASPIIGSATAVFDTLQSLVEMKLVVWQFEVASQLHPERDLAQRIDRIGDRTLRLECQRLLAELTDARDTVAAAAGDPDALARALDDVDTAFTRIAECAPTRRAGEMYAARSVLFEDCRRDGDVTFGREFLARLGPPLSIVLDGARWVSTRLRSEFTRELRVCLAQSQARLGTETVDAHLLLNYVGARGRELLAPLSRGILQQFQERWQTILAIPPDARRVARSAESLASAAREAFAVDGPSSWGSYFTPDIMVASANLDTFRSGRFHCVLGELHSNNTLLWSALVSQHPQPASLAAALERDTADGTVVVMQTPKARWVSRLNALTLPSFWRYEHGDDLPSLPACRALPAGMLLARDNGTCVRIAARDGSLEFDAYELFAVMMSYEADRIVSAMLRSGSHAPRVSIDDLTVSREEWLATPREMRFLHDSSPALLFAHARGWARAHGMPRFVFYKSPGETKPCFLDWASPLYVNVFSKFMRRLRDTASVRIVEMLPGLDDLWLTDAEGNLFTSEIRIVARPSD